MILRLAFEEVVLKQQLRDTTTSLFVLNLNFHLHFLQVATNELEVVVDPTALLHVAAKIVVDDDATICMNNVVALEDDVRQSPLGRLAADFYADLTVQTTLLRNCTS